MIALVVVLLAAVPAQAAVPCTQPVVRRGTPCQPDAIERDSIMESIEAALAKQRAWENARVKEQTAREAIAEAQRKKQRITTESLENWRNSLTFMNDREGEMRRAFSDVVKATQDNYGVGPKKRLGFIKGGPLNGQQTVWAPVIQEKEDLVYRSGSAQNPHYLRWQEAAGDGAATMDDGMVFISVDMLRSAQLLGSPAALAAMIDHEAAHFEELVGKKGWVGHSMGQHRAYARHEATGKAIGLEESELIRVKGLKDSYHADALSSELADTFLPGGYRPGPTANDYPWQKPSTVEKNFEAWKKAQTRLTEIRTQREGFDARLAARRRGEPDGDLRDGLNDSRHSCGGEGWWAGAVYMPSLPCAGTVRPAPQSVPVQPAIPSAPVPVQPAPPPFDIWGALKRLARQGCWQPGTVTQSQLDELWPNIFGMVYYPDAGVQLGLTGCDAVLLTRVVRWAADYKPRRFELSVFEYEASTARGDVGAVEPESPRGRGRDYPMPGSEPCLDGRATCGPVTPPKK